MLNSNTKYLKPLILCGLMITALVFHSLNLDYASYELDEAVHIWFAQKSFSEVVAQASNDPNPPIYNLIISVWVKNFGVSEFSTRFFSVLMGVFAVGAMFLIASRNFGLAVGMFAALFLCFSPVQFRFTHMARPYSMLMLSVILSYGALFESLKKASKRNLLLYYLASTAMIYIHPTSIFNVAAQGLIILWAKRNRIKEAFVPILVLSLAVVSFACWIFSIPYFERSHRMWFGPPNLDDVWYVLKVFYGYWPLALLQIALFLGLLVQKIRGKIDAASWPFVVLWCVVPLISSIIISYLFKPVFQDKYILSVQPAIMLLLAVSIGLLFKNRIAKIILGIAVLSTLAFTVEVTPPPSGGDWKGVVEYLKPLHDENNRIYISPWYEYRTFAFYYDRSFYEAHDNTINLLGAERVFTSWNDIYDFENDAPRCETVHVVLAHQGFVGTNISQEHLDSVAYLISEKKFPAILVKTYSYFPPVSNFSRQEILEFSDLENGVLEVSKKAEYSKAIVLPLDSFPKVALHVSCSVDLRGVENPEGVKFIMSVEKGETLKMVHYKVTHLSNELSEDTGWINLNANIILSEFESDWIVKAYVWNQKGAEFQIDNLKIVAEN